MFCLSAYTATELYRAIFNVQKKNKKLQQIMRRKNPINLWNQAANTP